MYSLLIYVIIFLLYNNNLQSLDPIKHHSQSPLKGLTKILNVVSYPRFRYRSLMNMNKKKAVTLDVIVVYDNSLCSIIQAMSAKQYFETRGQLFRDNQQSMTICTWDVIPGKAGERYKLKIGVRAVAIIIFASYDSDSQPHRLFLPPDTKDIMVLMNERTIILADNGMDYMDIGEQRKFAVMKKIHSENQRDPDNNIPSGYGNFYFLDRDQHPPAVIKDSQLQYKNIKITATKNIPVRIEENDINKFSDRDYHKPDNYILAKFSNFSELMKPKLKEDLFSEEGVINNNILRKHGMAFLYSSEMTKKSCYTEIDLFVRNKYKNFILMGKLNRALLSGRKSLLESDEYYEKLSQGAGFNNGNGAGNGINGEQSSGEGTNGNNSSNNGENTGNNGDKTQDGASNSGENSQEGKNNGSEDQSPLNSGENGKDSQSNQKNSKDGEGGKNGNGDNNGNNQDNNNNGNNPESLGGINGGQGNNNTENNGEKAAGEEGSENQKEAGGEGGGNPMNSVNPEGDLPDSQGSNSYGSQMGKDKAGMPKIPFGELGKIGSLAMGVSSKSSFWRKVAQVVKKGVSAVSNTGHKGQKVSY